MITLQRKTVDLAAWHLTDQSEMLSALSYLSEQGWRGAITFNSATSDWRIELNTDTPETKQVIAHTGDWLVIDVELRKISDAECTENYEVAQ